MNMKENFPLRAYNTFGITAHARLFAEINSEEELQELLNETDLLNNHHLILGGGSNVLFTGDFDGAVIKIATRGMEVIGETSQHILIQVSAGENWDGLVDHCVANNWGGLENLSLIPGQVGSSPIQNIGAYGVELKDHFHSLDAMHRSSGQIRTFNLNDCRFGYRDSFFKREGKDQFIILSVTLRLDKDPGVNIAYAALAKELERHGIIHPDIKNVREAVISVRQSKLPDPEKTGNAGSFFKNPVISEGQFHELSVNFPHIASFPDKGGIKIAAGWLVDQAGWKGYRLGDAGVHEKQALVLVNHGHASGKDIIDLARQITQSVREKFGIELQPEVNII